MNSSNDAGGWATVFGSEGRAVGNSTSGFDAESAATMAILAPEDVPPIEIRDVSICCSSAGEDATHLTASMESPTAAGKGFSGAKP